jgi:O-antigen/teichoic acid export membrane protein
MIKIGRVIMIILGFILISFILIGEEFILLWVGKTYEDSFMIALLIMTVSTVPLVQSFGNSILEANNKIKSKAILNLITMLLGVFAGFSISKEYGSVGMIICIVSALLVNSIITNIYFIKIFDFKIVLFFKKTFFSIILLLVLMIFIGSGINKLTTEISWLSLLLKGVILAIMYVWLSFLIVLNKDEKQIIYNYIKKN